MNGQPNLEATKPVARGIYVQAAGFGLVAMGSNCDYDPKAPHKLCDFNAGLPKKSHVWEEANTKKSDNRSFAPPVRRAAQVASN